MEQTVKHGKWSEGEDELLRISIENYGERHWNLISKAVSGRSPIQCLHRWTKILRPGLIKGAWSPEEDNILRAWVAEKGAEGWSACSKLIAGRSGKQCRERWTNNLDPNIIKGNWSKVEDELIFGAFMKEGPKWSSIALMLPGRTENSIKNRFYSTCRKLKHREVKKDKEEENKMNIEEDELNKDALALEMLIEDIQRKHQFRLSGL